MVKVKVWFAIGRIQLFIVMLPAVFYQSICDCFGMSGKSRVEGASLIFHAKKDQVLYYALS